MGFEPEREKLPYPDTANLDGLTRKRYEEYEEAGIPKLRTALFCAPSSNSHMKKYMEEPKKDNFEILLEDIQADVKKVLEATDTHTQQLGRLEGTVEEVQATLTKMDDRLATVETILESVNMPALKQKVMTLERRLDVLEAKAK